MPSPSPLNRTLGGSASSDDDVCGSGDSSSSDEQYDILENASRYVQVGGPLAYRRKVATTGDGLVAGLGLADNAEREFLDARARLRDELRFMRPQGTEYLRQAKARWINSRPGIDPYMPQHRCASGSCHRVQVTMRVFVRGSDHSTAHLCLYDHQRNAYLCGREGDDTIHSRECALVDHPRLYFCDKTGRVHVCGEGMCLIAAQDIRRDDDYQITCPVTGQVVEHGASGGMTIGSAFWRPGDAVGSTFEQQSVAEYDACLSPSADDLSRLTYMHQKQAEIDQMLASTTERQRAARKRKAAIGSELDKYIQAKSGTTFVSRKKLFSPIWLEWSQKYADWDSWLDMLLQMQTHAKVAEHLHEITGESYRRVWRLHGVVVRYVAGLVYAIFCRERYEQENRNMCHDMVKSIRRAGSNLLASPTILALPSPPPTPSSSSSRDATCPQAAEDAPMIFSQLVDTTMGSLTLARHGDVYTNSPLSMSLSLSGSTGSDSGMSALVVPQHSHTDRTQEGTMVLAGSTDDRFASGELHAMRTRVVGYTHRILRLWMLVNETAVDLPQDSAPAYPNSRIDCFPLAHFVFAALECLAYGISSQARDEDSGYTYLRYLLPADDELLRVLPREWSCMGSGLFEHNHVKLVKYNVRQTLTTAVSSGRLSVEHIIAGRYQQQHWSDVDLEACEWSRSVPGKIIFRNPPHSIGIRSS